MNYSPLQLLSIQIEALYRCDEQGRLLKVNEPGGTDAPLVFLGRTAEGNVWRFRRDLSASIVAEVERVCQAEPVVNDFSAPLQGYDAILAALANDTPRSVWRGPCYSFADRIEFPSTVVEITNENAHLLSAHFADMVPLEEERTPIVAKVIDDAAVALCFSSRRTPRACEAGLETVEAHRRRGYAAAVVAGWAAAVQASGRIALYSTSWENKASQAVARKLDLSLYGEDVSFG